MLGFASCSVNRGASAADAGGDHYFSWTEWLFFLGCKMKGACRSLRFIWIRCDIEAVDILGSVEIVIECVEIS